MQGKARPKPPQSRTAAAGANYFGRSTGLADKLIAGMDEGDVRNHKMDRVRAQQKENWSRGLPCGFW